METTSQAAEMLAEIEAEASPEHYAIVTEEAAISAAEHDRSYINGWDVTLGSKIALRAGRS